MDDNQVSSQEESKDSLQKENKAPVCKNKIWGVVKKVLSYIFIDGLSGMALGLFATLIIGTIICQIGSFFGTTSFAYYVKAFGSIAKVLMGAGIGIGMAYKLKKAPLVSVSAGVAGLVGAFASNIVSRKVFNETMSLTSLASVGEPLGAFIAAFVAIEVGSLVSGKTKVDIIITPLVAITAGSVVGLLLGVPIKSFMDFIRNIINVASTQQPILMGILVAVLMGIALTLPISSAAIGVMILSNPIAAGAGVIGCCCHMVGFAVMSFRENKWGGLIAQGIGTSMLQMPNLVKHPLCWLPPIIASAILGPIGVAVGIVSSPVGSGMGTSGLVGIFETITTMTKGNEALNIAAKSPAASILLTLLICVVLPAILILTISEIFRKFNLIKKDDLKLDL